MARNRRLGKRLRHVTKEKDRKSWEGLFVFLKIIFIYEFIAVILREN